VEYIEDRLRARQRHVARVHARHHGWATPPEPPGRARD
jgi:hypothetical protein